MYHGNTVNRSVRWTQHVLLFSMLLILIQINGYSQKGAPKVNIDQGDNGQSSVPNSPVIWVNGNLNTTKTHYIEGQSIPYRISLDNIPLGTPITVRIGFDLRNSGHFAIDYLTSDTFAFKHAVFFKHPPEKVIPELGIPDPIVLTQYAPLPDPGNKNSPTGWSQQPQASFDLVKAAGNANMALKNAVFQSNPVWVSGKSPDYSESNSSFEAQMDVTIIASALPVIIGFGGHIASRFDWGTLPNGQARSAGGISGSPYHMRVIQLDYNGSITSIGNQDRSLQIAAPECLNLSVLISNQQNLLCNGTGSGSVLLSSSGGTPGFQFSIDSGKTYQFSNLFSGLAPGDYLFTVRDTIGCTNTVSTTISSPPVLSKSGIVSNILCFGAENGSIDLSVSGGTPGYTYAWSNGATSQDLSGLSAGTYSVLITDVNNCEARDTFQISQPASAILASANVTDILCYGDNTGAIDLSVSGGTASYTYEWLTGQTTQDLSGLQAGVFSVLITDANGCTKRDTFTIKQPEAALAAAFKSVDVLCYGDSTGSIDMTVTSGTAPYNYAWSNGATSEDLSNLKVGTYVVVLTDDNGCTVKDSVIIEQPLAPLMIQHQKTDVLCFDQKTGAIDVTVSGGSPDYSYAWSNGATTADISDLAAGTYILLVTDVSGCIKRDTIEITQPASAILASANVTDILCYGDNTGAIDLSVSGGTASYTYEWLTGQTTQDLSGLQAGVFSVLITDANGCTKRDTFTIKQPDAALAVAFKHVDVLCYGDSTGSIDMTVTDGTKPYGFEWSNGAVTEDLSNLKEGTYVVLVTDDNGCVVKDSVEIDQPLAPVAVEHKKVDVLCYSLNTGSVDLSVSGGSPDYSYAWSNGATSQDLFNLTAGIYTVVVTDQSGCIKKDTIEIIEPAAGLSIKAAIKDLDCFGVATGGIDLTVEGGTAGFSYSWSNGATTEDLSGIAAGIYSVTVTDSNLCFLKDTFEVKQPDASLDFSLKQVDVLCYGDSSGSIDLDVTGGTKPYSYTWSNGATTEDLSNVKAGVYAVLVTDDKGCSKEDSIEVLQPKSALSVRAKITDVLCKGDETGSIDITVSGGTASYQFSWSSGEDTEDISGKSAGVYYVLITDANQCTLKDTFEIEEPTEKLSVSGSATDLKCYNDQSGSIDITVAGGIVSYSYSWSNGSTSEDLTGISAGTYTVTVTDKNGCFVKETFVVNQPDSLVVNADDKKVCAGVSVDLTASPSGGVWSGSGVTGSAFMSELPGIYAVYYTYTNLSGCVGIDTAYVNVERCSQGFCTYTQGYYGNPGGKSCAEGLKYSTKGLMQLALSKGSIVLGNASLNRTFTIAYNSVDTVIAILPGGGPAGMLAYTGNRTPSKLPPAMLKNGKINNVLLSQTIALSFNLRVNSELDSFKVRSDKFLMTQDKVSCESKDVKDCAYHSYKFSSKVVNALNGNKTIADLLKLANNALAGSLPAGLSYSDVAGAVDLVNNAFDGCKVGWYSDTVVYCPIVDVSSSASNISANEQPVQLNIEQMAKQPTVKPYPNPFEDMVRFTIESPESIQCNLILYTSAGRMISKVFDGKVEANVSTTVQALVPSMYKGAIMYVLSYNGKVVTGTVLKK